MRQWEQERQEWQRGCFTGCVGNAAVSGSVPGMREKVLHSAKGKEKGTAAMEFRMPCSSASAALLAGYSVENAWRETEKELLELHGEKGFMAAEVRWMNEGVRMNETIGATVAFVCGAKRV